MGNVVTVGPNTALVISSGRNDARIRVGGAFVLYCLQRVDRLSLELRTIEVNSNGATTLKGVPVNVLGICQVKVSGFKESSDGRLLRDDNAIRLAAQHFLGATEAEIEATVKRTMEGHQRAILGTLTIEEIYRERTAFSNKVRELAAEDVRLMGLEIVSYTIASLTDDEGYLDALGVTQVEEVKRKAQEGKAINDNAARKIIAEQNLNASLYENEAKKKQEESNRDVITAQQHYNEEINVASARAEAARGIETTKQEVVKLRETTKVNEEEVRRKRVELDGTVKATAEAELYMQERKAEGALAASRADAERIRLIGAAEADAARLKAQVEIEVMQSKADAYKHYGHAALAVQSIEMMPKIAAAIAKPLENTDRMVFMAGGSGENSGGPSRLIQDIARSMTTVTETASAMTGIDVNEVIKKYAESYIAGGGGGADGGGGNNPARPAGQASLPAAAQPRDAGAAGRNRAAQSPARQGSPPAGANARSPPAAFGSPPMAPMSPPVAGPSPGTWDQPE